MGRTLEALLVLGKEAHVALAQSTQQEEAEGLKFQCVGRRGGFPVQVGKEVEGNSFSYQKRSRFHLTDGTRGEGRSFPICGEGCGEGRRVVLCPGSWAGF